VGEGRLAGIVRAQSDENLKVYAASDIRVDEDAGQEMNLAHGGYGKRQLLELIQNGADAMIGTPGGRIEVVLTAEYLYCANEGDPIDEDGIGALLHAHISRKRDAEIGRFGLGFKSVLGVTDRPEFFCTEVSFGFDAEWSRQEIERVAPGHERYPALRLARLLDPQCAAEEDPLLSELMSFATTVVRVPRTIGSSAWLSSDVQEFDPAFMLFSPHVGELTLSDRTIGVRRDIRLVREGDEVAISEGADSRRWRVFKGSIQPSEAAKTDAWELAARKELPVVWAVPVEGRLTVGRFWAFFPLRDETTLTGIANAPWHINDDRTGLLEGSALNKELLEELSRLVLESISVLVKKDDPGWILDVVPARGREARCWGDDYLTTRFYESAVDQPVIPDQSGVLRAAVDLVLPPSDASRAALDCWANIPSRPSVWCHASAVGSTTRRSRVERLFDAAGRKEAPVSRWLEALLVDDFGTDEAAHVVRTAATFIGEPDADGAGRRRSLVQRSRIVLDAEGELALAKSGEIYIPRDDGGEYEVRVVAPMVVARDGAKDALAVIGIEEVTPSLELKAFVTQTLRAAADDWQKLWRLARRIDDVGDAVTVLRQAFGHRDPSVRTMSGDFQPLARTLLPGAIVPSDGSRDASVVIDVEFHKAELEVLRGLGADQAPTAGYAIERDEVVARYRDLCVREYIHALPDGSSTPAWDYLVFDQKAHVGPLEPLQFLSDDGRAAFTEELIKATTDWSPWTLKHSTNRSYPQKQFAPAAVWAVSTDGRVPTSLGVWSPRRAWGRAFERWKEVVPVADLADADLKRFGGATDLSDITDALWDDALGSAAELTDDSVLGAFYAFAADTGVAAPDRLRCRVGTAHAECETAVVVVTHNREAFRALRDLQKPSLLVTSSEDAALLVERWGVQASASHVRQELHWVEASPAATLGDAFPTLRAELESAGLASAEFIPCEEIYETITTDAGTDTVEKQVEWRDDRFLWVADLGLEEALRRLAPRLPFELAEEEIVELAEGRWKQDRRDRLAAIRDKLSNEARLLEAVGEQCLRSRLPIGLIDAVTNLHGPLTPTEVARLMLVVQGDDALHFLRDDLRGAGLEPPDRWAGTREARAFVRDLGFPDEFAGAPAARRDPEHVVLGPPDLKQLHDYQASIVAEVDKLISGAEEHPRGLISLPTGAGKTRVAVEALVRALSEGRIGSPILWIAQSDELCEQAVQAWSEVWRAIGTIDELRIGRLWQTNEVPESIESRQVVVATIDKLRGRVDSDDYTWLADATCVVVDEAHSAITPEYTRVLRWLGISASGRTMTTRVPLLGLTATPFRGKSRDETERLVNRFGGRRLDRLVAADDDYEAMYRQLQEMKVLSQVDGEELETGTTIDVGDELSSDERSAFNQRRDLQQAKVFDRIAVDADRNRLLLDSITSRPRDWPILLFAVSTDHAHTMAALLTLAGVSAAAIDYRTEPAVRRRYVDRFRRGELQVLANFNVLTQGFDAPAVRAIYVARPTFSPNNYQQMIGRGLRGPANGGKERCLIVNVRDNWTMYGDRLAFYEFEHLWKPSPPEVAD
jgi:superfamily II DNA or RNA helicase